MPIKDPIMMITEREAINGADESVGFGNLSIFNGVLRNISPDFTRHYNPYCTYNSILGSSRIEISEN